jgi:hypothetical protein
MSRKLEAVFQPNSDLTQFQKDSVVRVREKALELAKELYPSDSREKSLAMTKLEECVMWAVKGLTS